MLTLLYFIIILGLIVLVHEFGHFIFAKLFGVYVYEFSIGMGPRICGTKHKKGKTTYNIRALPIGGFVALAGEDPEEKDSEVPDGGYLYQKPIWQRAIIMGAGVFNNFVLAILLLFLIGLFYGSPSKTPVISSLEAGYPSYELGLKEGDIIKEINGNHISTRDDAQLYLVLENDGTETEFVVLRDGKEYTYSVPPLKVENAKTKEVSYRYGMSFVPEYEHGVVNAIKYAFRQVWSYIKQIIITFQYLFTGRLGLNNLSGPVGIYSFVGEASKQHALLNLSSLTALLCINVGFINILPFPAFDGGRIFMLIIEKLRGKPVNPKIENAINSVGFMLLMGLTLVITCSDILKLFH